MPVSPRDLLTLSQTLNRPGCNEATRRCVASRAYYAALHGTESTFPKLDVRKDGESSHAEIIGRASKYAAQDLPGRMYASEIAKILPKIRRLRNLADYMLDAEFVERECSDVVQRALFVLDKCDDVQRLRQQAEGGEQA